MSCRCNSCCKPKENCAMTLRKFHCLINEAKKCYCMAEQCENKCLCDLIQALKALEKTFDFIEKGNCLEEKASRLLDNSTCCFDCNRDSCECRELAEKAMHYYDLKEEALENAYELIENAICKLNAAKEYDAEAKCYEKKYNKCIHAKDCNCR